MRIYMRYIINMINTPWKGILKTFSILETRIKEFNGIEAIFKFLDYY